MQTQILLIASILLVALWIVWNFRYSPLRSTLAIGCRILWALPLLLAIFPQHDVIEKQRTLHHPSLQVLIDDSKSMDLYQDEVRSSLSLMRERCHEIGCRLETHFLSQVTSEMKTETHLNKGLESWLFHTGSDPWVLLSDGGDVTPTLPWKASLKGSGERHGKKRGLFLHPKPPETRNVSVEKVDLAPFAFEGQKVPISLFLTRQYSDKKDVLQVSVEAEEQRLLTKNIVFPEGQKRVTLDIETPSMPRGQHLLTVKVLPSSDEKVVWDNIQHKSLEVLPNTVGILHLLGAPSWDGRYLRRYLKSEPKYDLISFFILRDPWDSQRVNERELSLIPFPVSKLFNEELPNFRVIVLQNFSLLQFLLPEYQKNLVRFVKNGGGLLFLGGDRSLVDGDLHDSPLKEILPFHTNPTQDFSDRFDNEKHGPWYDEKKSFRIGFANPTEQQRSLADVYTSWQGIASELQGFDNIHGLHHMENVDFHDDEYTPLLNAVTPQGTTPLAVASYPGKGRALWVFSDTMWKLGVGGDRMSRTVYSKFMNGAMQWLLREELTQPVVISQIHLEKKRKGVQWEVLLRGPAIRYFQQQGHWNMYVCGTKVDLNQAVIESMSVHEKRVKGYLPLHMQGGDRCKVDLQGEHDAFGSTTASMTGVFPEMLKDDEVGVSGARIRQLLELTKAKGVRFDAAEQYTEVTEWLSQNIKTHIVDKNVEYETILNPHWFLKFQWIWLLLFFMPLEVLIRKWDQIATS